LEAWSVLFIFVLVGLEVGWDLFIFVVVGLEVTEAVTDLFSVVEVVVVVVTVVVVVWATAVLVT
jgi:hypothetical protein